MKLQRLDRVITALLDVADELVFRDGAIGPLQQEEFDALLTRIDGLVHQQAVRASLSVKRRAAGDAERGL